MKRCWIFAPCFLMLSMNLVAQEAQTAPDEPSDMKRIFDGKSLEGWDGDSRLWSVKGGAIHGETTPDNQANGNTFLIWQDGGTKDFELRLSFRCLSLIHI